MSLELGEEVSHLDFLGGRAFQARALASTKFLSVTGIFKEQQGGQYSCHAVKKVQCIRRLSREFPGGPVVRTSHFH